MKYPRVVSLIASSTEMVVALGRGDSLVGCSHECDHPAWVRDLPALTRPKMRTSRPSAGIDQSVKALVEQGVSVYEVDAEALAALEPDVILTQTQCEVCAVSETDVLAAVGEMLPNARIVSLVPNSLADIWTDLRKVADALGVSEVGVREVTRLHRRMKAVASRCAAFADRPRVACIEWIEPLMAAGNWTPELIEMAGGNNLFGEAGKHAPFLEWESIVAADPDFVLVTPCGFDLERTRAEMHALHALPGWGDLRAVREGRVVLGDGNAYFNRPGPRVVETLEIVAEALHPDAFRFGHEGTGWVRY